MNLPIAPAVAIILGGLAAFGIAAMPVPVLESLVLDSGLPALVAAAEPPLGMTARALLAFGIGGLAGAFAWLAAFILFGSASLKLGGRRRPVAAAAGAADTVVAPVLRRADAHPDAPPRPPLLATRDLGAPFAEEVEPIEGLPLRPVVTIEHEPAEPLPLRGAEPLPADPVLDPVPVPQVDEVDSFAGGVAPEPATEVDEVDSFAPPAEPVERPLPADLDQPLAAFDPESIPPVPMPSPIPAPRRRAQPAIFEPHERFETFELPTPAPQSMSKPDPIVVPEAPAPAPEVPEPIARPETEASVHALLERLERGVTRRNQAQAAKTTQTRQRRNDHGLEDALATLRNLARQA